MKAEVFHAICPYEIGDKIQVLAPVKGNKDGEAYMIEFATITDIACIHYVRKGKVDFTYELDGSGEYIPLITAKEARLTI